MTVAMLQERLCALAPEMPVLLRYEGDCAEVAQALVSEGWNGHERQLMLLLIGGEEA